MVDPQDVEIISSLYDEDRGDDKGYVSVTFKVKDWVPPTGDDNVIWLAWGVVWNTKPWVLTAERRGGLRPHTL